MKSIYKSQKGKEILTKLYHEKLASLELDYTFKTVKTWAGDTNIVVVGEAHHPPVVLLHGVNAGAPIALEPIKGMAKDHRIYAIDVVGQPNLSAETRPEFKGDGYGKWLTEVVDALQLEQVPYIGVSLGAVILQKFMMYAPSRIERVIFCVPGGMANGNAMESMRKVFWPMMKYKITGSEKHLRQFMSAFFTDSDEFNLRFIRAILDHVVADHRMPPVFKDADFKDFTNPVYLMVAKDDLFFPKEKVIERAPKLFKGFKEIAVLEGKHAPGKAVFGQIEELVRRFLK